MLDIVVYITLLTILSLFSNEMIRRFSWIAWTVFLVVPAFFTYWWINSAHEPIFYWFKVYSVLLGGCWLLAVRFTPLKEYRWPFILGYCMFVINVMEAVVQDVSAGQWFNFLNAVAGLLLLISQVRYEGMRVNLNSPYHDFEWNLTLLWIIGYTIWNWTFVYLNFPDQLGRVSAILLAALLIGIIKPKLWFQTRVFTLGVSVIILFSYKPLFTYVDTTILYHHNIGIICAMLSFMYMAVYTIYALHQKLRLSIVGWVRRFLP